MANNPTLMNTSQTARLDSYCSEMMQLQQSQDVDFLKNALGQINLDASESNFSSSFLNETLSVYALLASVGLEIYMDMFAEHNIELEQFLELTYLDLQLFGIDDCRHRNLIMEVIAAFRFD
ncbi:uncharacterized protein LOC126762508 [Bactrocera neohumeralis]|uniref:uncharacterized protein LOC120777258 n=1 Tax=Bactrocera tryoni TaxID=59916 RepID=UPI001A9A21AB|nr:uncharacterized protein LOC120777258 [Bactrocera tryoni]XP_050335259.1 uncharacterized protein LOC126762508 [Bactrocera neohumeralis]